MSNKPTLRIHPQEEPPASREPGNEDDRKPFPPQRGWKHDNRAGVEQLFYSDSEKGIYEAWLKFRDGDPGEKVRDFLKDNHYRWQPGAPSGGRWPEVKGAWARPTNYETLSRDRLQHERMYAAVVDMMLAEKGLAPTQDQAEGEGIPF